MTRRGVSCRILQVVPSFQPRVPRYSTRMEGGRPSLSPCSEAIELISEYQIQARQYERFLFLLFLLTLPLMNPWVRGDGVGYYAYARAPLIEHSLDFTHDYQYANQSFRADHVDAAGLPRPEFRTLSGHLDNHFSVGPAILWSPFLLLAHAGVLLARALGSSVVADGFSAPYRYAMAFGTAFYGFIALLLSFRLACRYLRPLWSFLATIAIWWASSLPVYMYFNPSWSHAHSAFVVALFLVYWDATRESRTLQQWLILGLIVGLMLNVYYPNLMVLSILLLEAIGQYAQAFRSGTAAFPSSTQLLARHLLFGLVVCLALLPTFVSRWIVYGGPFKTGYLSLRDFLWSSPVFLQVLFSSNYGLFSWTPLLALACLGLILGALHIPRIGVPLLVASVAFYLFIAFYPDWAGISSFGNRFFVSLTPMFVLGLAMLLQRFAANLASSRTATFVSSGVLACFVLWNLGLIYQWGTHLVPVRGPISFRQAAYNQFVVVPGEMSHQLRSYLFRRSDLMRQIEQRDVEQLKKDAQP
jgi:hypothetical protein